MRVHWKVWDEVWDKEDGYCAYCGVDLAASFNLWMSATVDHVVCVAVGGAYTADNLVLACGACNGMLSRASELQTIEERHEYLKSRRAHFEKKYQSYKRQPASLGEPSSSTVA